MVPNGAQEIHFRLLVEFSAAKLIAQKDIIGRQIISGLKRVFDRQEVEHNHEFLVSPLLPKIQVLLSFTDLNRTPESLAPLLGVPTEEVVRALDRFHVMGLAERENDQWIPKKQSFVVHERLGDLSLNLFHRRSLEEAIKAQDYPAETRRYKSLLLALSEREFQVHHR